jgi:hypothetical protein
MKVALGQAAWRKSTYSAQVQNCVEVADGLQGAVAVRDSKDPDGPALVLASAEWRMLARRVKAGDFV